VLWREPAQLDPAEGWDGVDADVLLAAFEGAGSDGVADDGEPFGEERGGAAVGGQGLAFSADLSSCSSLAAASLRLLARRTTRRPSSMMRAATQRPSLARR